MSPGGVAGVLLDRDGVITRHRADYVKSWDEVEVLPGVADAVALLCESGYQVAIVTNQSAVGRGLMTMATLDSIHRGLDEIIRAAGGKISGYLVCPHRPERGCDCRKPRPGMLREAGRLLGVDLAGTYMVGDRETDVIAALSAGCRPILLQADTSTPPPERDPALRCPTVANLAAAADLILAGPNQAESSRRPPRRHAPSWSSPPTTSARTFRRCVTAFSGTSTPTSSSTTSSPDGTSKIADALARTQPRLHVVRRGRKQGVASAHVLGFRHALQHGYDAGGGGRGGGRRLLQSAQDLSCSSPRSPSPWSSRSALE